MSAALRLKLRLGSTLPSTRSYATRLPQRPPYRAPDPLINNPNVVHQPLPDNSALTFIHRPPPSAPDPLSYSTNPASPFLKPAPSPSSGGGDGGQLPPTLRAGREVPWMSTADMALLRKLRMEDPVTWTRGRLARRFNCSPGFVKAIASLRKQDRKQALAKRDEEHERFRSQWGPKKILQKEIREKRREFW